MTPPVSRTATTLPLVPVGILGTDRSWHEAALASLDVGVAVYGRDLKLISCNPSALRILGLTQEQFEERGLFDPRWECVHEDGTPFPAQTFPVTVAIRDGAGSTGTTMGVRRPGGSTVWISVCAHPIRRPGETEPWCAVASFEDITERRRADAELRDGEARFRTIFESTRDGIFLLDGVTLRVLDANPSACASFRMTREEARGLTILDLSAEPELTREAVARRDELVGVRHYRARDGRTFPVELTASYLELNGRPAITLVFRDIGPRVEAERVASERGRNARLQADALTRLSRSDALRHLGLDAALAEITEVAAETLGVDRVGVWTVSDDAGTLVCRHLYERAARRHTLGDELSLSARGPYFRAIREDRTVAAEDVASDPRTAEFAGAYSAPLKIVSLIDAPVRRLGSVIGVVCHEVIGARRAWTGEDESFAASIADFVALAVESAKRSNAERALRDGEERLRVLTENLPGVVYSYLYKPDGSRRILYVSRAWTEIVGPRTASWIGEDLNQIRSLIHPEDWEGYIRASDAARTGVSVFDHEFRVKTDSGYRWIRAITNPVPKGGGEIVWHGVILDAEERRAVERSRAALQHQLWQSQKHDALGTLAAGVAHDLNNVLTAVNCAAVVARSQLPENHPARQPLGMIEMACTQAHGVTRGLLAFARESPPARENIDLRTAVREFVPVVRGLLPANLRLHDPEPGPPVRVCADAVQVQQVLMNLVLNSRDAMPDGGDLFLRVGESDGGGFLEVEDTGHGIPDAVRERMFDPFFTTKARGKGTGLGLAIVHGIVQGHGGRIDVESPPGRGARFRVTLPSATPDAPARGKPGVAPPAGRGLVLLAEDHEQVRELLARGLRDAGFEVLTAADGAEAVTLAESSPRPIDAAVLDSDMPRMTGEACLARLRERRAGLPGVVITGRIDDVVDAPADDRTRVMRKPLTAPDLVKALGAMLRPS